MHRREIWGRGAKRPAQPETGLGAGLCPLSDLEAGTTGTVRELRGGREFAGRVAGMGIAIGATLRVVQNYGEGPIMIDVRDTRLALGRGEAMKIVVEVAPEG